MAKSARVTSIATKSELKPADAWANVSVSVGGEFKQLGGLPLHLETALHQALINNADKVSKMVFKVELNIPKKPSEIVLDFAE